MKQSLIVRASESEEYFFREGCFILELLNSEADPDLSIAKARVMPGVTTHFHCLRGVSERYLIQKGQGLVTVGNNPAETVSPGSVVLIPPGVRQKIENTGTDQLEFLAICTPRFTPECYESLEGP